MFVIKCLWFLLPAGLANMAPVLVKGYFKKMAVPIDLNKKFKGRPVFGPNKTWRGIIFGIIFALIFFAIQKWLYQYPFFKKLSLINYNEISLFFGFLLGLGAVLGDLIKSFFKRRLGIGSGKPWIIFDQIDWMVGALIFSSLIYLPSWSIIITLLILALILHPLVNYIGFLLKMKENKF